MHSISSNKTYIDRLKGTCLPSFIYFSKSCFLVLTWNFFFEIFFCLKEQRMAEGGEGGYGGASSNNDVSKRGGCYKSKFVQHLREVRNIIRVVGG